MVKALLYYTYHLFVMVNIFLFIISNAVVLSSNLGNDELLEVRTSRSELLVFIYY